jgi:tetratricopeptide (TPR) repeat protein
MKYRAFLSYSHVDQKWARWLHRALEGYRPPAGLRSADGSPAPPRLGPVFRDLDELPTTSSLSDAVQAALGAADALIVICSPAAAASRWVNEEIRKFRALGRTDRIFCLLVAGEPGAGGADECFPPALLEPATPGGAPLEPVAADARPQGEGRRNALLRIAAGMLGVGLDALRQRDLRRRQRRLLTITSGSLLITVVTVLLAISAVIARNDAQARRAQAEDLIDFMLGDLQEQLRGIGRLDVFESVGDKALEYFAAQRSRDDNETTLAQRARNLRLIGEVRSDQGDLPAALEAFNGSLLIVEELARRAPDDPAAQIGMANSLFYVGYIHWQRGELREARGLFASIVTIVDAVSARDPDQPKWLVERAYAHTNLGRVQELEGLLEDALLHYRAVMEINRRLVELEPDNPEWRLELGFAHNNLGKLFVSLGRLDEAENHFREDLRIKRDYFDSDRKHNVHRSYLGVSQHFLGRLLAERGSYGEGEDLLAEAREHYRFLCDVDPERTGWLLRRAGIDRDAGRLFAAAGRVDKAQPVLREALETFESLTALDADNAAWRRELLRAQLAATDLALSAGRGDEARALLSSAAENLQSLIEQEPTSQETQELAVWYDLRAFHAGQSGSMQSLVSTLDTLDRHFADSRDPRILELRWQVLATLGRPAEAASLRQELNAGGYRGFLPDALAAPPPEVSRP